MVMLSEHEGQSRSKACTERTRSQATYWRECASLSLGLNATQVLPPYFSRLFAIRARLCEEQSTPHPSLRLPLSAVSKASCSRMANLTLERVQCSELLETLKEGSSVTLPLKIRHSRRRTTPPARRLDSCAVVYWGCMPTNLQTI